MSSSGGIDVRFHRVAEIFDSPEICIDTLSSAQRGKVPFFLYKNSTRDIESPLDWEYFDSAPCMHNFSCDIG